MSAVLFLICAIICEVIATATLRVAALGRRHLYVVVVLGYAVAFAFLSLALDRGFGLGAAYGIWTAAGVALTALVARVLFAESLNRMSVTGIGVIMLGVLLIEVGAQH